MINRVVARTDLSDITDTSSFKQFLRAVASEFGEAYYQTRRLQDLFGIRTAAGEDLDEVARTIFDGLMFRLGPRPAIGLLEFERPGTAGTEIIPIGTAATRLDGVSYRTIDQGAIPNLSAVSGPIPAVATAAGFEGNAASGTVVRLGSAVGSATRVRNITAMLQGRSNETDDQFRARLLRYVESLSRCTVGAIEVSVIGIQNPDGTGQEVVNSHLFEDLFSPGNTTLYIDDGAGTARQSQKATPIGGGATAPGPFQGNASITDAVGGEVTLTDPNANFVQALVSESITIGLSTPVGNNGVFIIDRVTSPTTLVYLNGNGVSPITDPDALGFTYNIDEVVIRPAFGGEEFLFLEQHPIDDSLPVIIVSSARGTLTSGTDYFLNPTSGLLFFTPPLLVGENIFATDYEVFTGLIPEVQRAVDGDPNDRANFPGLRAAGIRCKVRAPRVRNIVVEAVLTIEDGVSRVDTVKDAEKDVEFYINTLGISGDVVRNEIIARIMEIRGVIDVNLIVPACGDPFTDPRIVIDDDEIARIQASTLHIT